MKLFSFKIFTNYDRGKDFNMIPANVRNMTQSANW